ATRARIDATESEQPAILEKELALLGKEETEAREIDLLLVGLDLREVGVVGEVGRQVLREAVLHVDADVTRDVVGHSRNHTRVARETGDCVWLDLEIARSRRRLEADDG